MTDVLGNPIVDRSTLRDPDAMIEGEFPIWACDEADCRAQAKWMTTHR